jgi:hypothetical protein
MSHESRSQKPAASVRARNKDEEKSRHMGPLVVQMNIHKLRIITTSKKKSPCIAMELRLLHGGSLNDLWLRNLFYHRIIRFNSF